MNVTVRCNYDINDKVSYYTYHRLPAWSLLWLRLTVSSKTFTNNFYSLYQSERETWYGTVADGTAQRCDISLENFAMLYTQRTVTHWTISV